MKSVPKNLTHETTNKNNKRRHSRYPLQKKRLTTLNKRNRHLSFLIKLHPRIFIICCLTLILLVITIYQTASSLQSTHQVPKDNINDKIVPSTTVILFAGKNITAGEIDSNGLAKAQQLIKKGIYDESVTQQALINRYALYTSFDKIETERQMLLYKVHSTDELVKQVSLAPIVNDNEAYQFYISHPDLFARSVARIHVREIMMKDHNIAFDVLNQLHAGVSFEQLARQYSLDPQQYRDNGGDMGWVTEKQMSWEWDRVAFSLAPHQISNIFQTGSLYCIVQLIEGPQYTVIPYNLIAAEAPGIVSRYLQQKYFLIWLSKHIIQEPLTVLKSSYTMVVQDAMDYLKMHLDQETT